MSYRVGTPNYNLPQTEGTDKRDWADTNQAFLAIDTAIKNAVDTSASASSAASTAQQTADGANTAAAHAQTDATTAQTLATSASEQATLAKSTADTAKTTADTAKSTADSVSTALSVIGDVITLSDSQTNVANNLFVAIVNPQGIPAGTYVVHGWVNFAATNSTGARALKFASNTYNGKEIEVSPNQSGYTQLMIDDIVTFDEETDSFVLQAKQSSGGTMNISGQIKLVRIK